MANGSYLTPDWLMSDINQLLSRSRKGLKKSGGEGVLSQKEFEDKYMKGQESGFSSLGRTGGFGNPRLWEYSDWTQDIEGGYDWSGAHYAPLAELGVGGGRWLSDKSDAYTEYLQALGYSPETGYGQGTSNIFDREQFVGDIGEARGIAPEGRTPADAFTEFTPQMFKKLRTEYYQPQIEEGRKSLLDNLMQKNRLASSRGGSFAGYGGRERERGKARHLYGQGVEGIYADVEQERAGALQNIYDVLGQYETIT